MSEQPEKTAHYIGSQPALLVTAALSPAKLYGYVADTGMRILVLACTNRGRGDSFCVDQHASLCPWEVILR
jgi:hypothetical protein